MLDVIEVKYLKNTAEGAKYLESGTPEFQYAIACTFNEEVPKSAVEDKVGKEIAKIGFAKAMQKKWVQLCGEKKENIKRIVKDEDMIDEDKDMLLKIAADSDPEKHDKKIVDGLKKRQLLTLQSKKTYRVTKGPNYMPKRQKLETQLTADMLRTGAWKDTQFKKYNLNAVGQVPQGGHFHPLLKVRAQFRQILLEMGFNEMPTQRYVESSFWNFDSLFQPQSHPARDAHDTFFLTKPEQCLKLPNDYVERVRNTHENGLEGSFGYGPGWSLDETKKNILRTHTTAISSQMLYKLANQPGGFKPMKYFSIDRVFRNETLDATHLAEFH